MKQILQDSVLVSNYIKGDELALGKLIERHKQRIYSFIYSLHRIRLIEDRPD
jgi:RNA polymerase sigma-70 factor (ECF subfamily)